MDNQFFDIHNQPLIRVYDGCKSITGGGQGWEIDLKRNDSESSFGMQIDFGQIEDLIFSEALVSEGKMGKELFWN